MSRRDIFYMRAEENPPQQRTSGSGRPDVRAEARTHMKYEATHFFHVGTPFRDCLKTTAPKGQRIEAQGWPRFLRSTLGEMAR